MKPRAMGCGRHYCPVENIPGIVGKRDRIAACGERCDAASGTCVVLYVRCRKCVALLGQYVRAQRVAASAGLLNASGRCWAVALNPKGYVGVVYALDDVTPSVSTPPRASWAQAVADLGVRWEGMEALIREGLS